MKRVVFRNLPYIGAVVTRHVRGQQQKSECLPAWPPCPPPLEPPPFSCCPPPPTLYPPFYCCPRTKYDVNFIYINDIPPKTGFRDFVDRIAQTLFWTELIRGTLFFILYFTRTKQDNCLFGIRSLN